MAASMGSYAPNQPYFRGINKNAIDMFRNPGMDGLVCQPLRPPLPQDFHPGTLACADFFTSMGEQHFETSFEAPFWVYEMRRQAQHILPYLYLGPVSAARNAEYLRSEGITLLVGIRSKHPSFTRIVNADKTAQELGIQLGYVEVDQVSEMTSVMPNVIREINNHVCCCPNHNATVNAAALPKKALVFCETGNEKSLAIVTGYLMAMLNLELYTALTNIQARRLCVNFGHTESDMLRSWQAILQAQRDVSNAYRQMTLTLNPRALAVPGGGSGSGNGGIDSFRKKRSFAEADLTEPLSAAELAAQNFRNAGGSNSTVMDDYRQPSPPFADRPN